MTNKPDVSIIIPAHNEEEGIVDVINGTKQLNKGYEILVIDDGSTDNTYKLATETGVKVIRHPYNKGYGAALKTGIRNAAADIVLFMDADGQHKPSDIQKLTQFIGEYDMVVGARTKKSKISLLRRPGKKILSITANYLAGMKIPDLNSGFRALRKDVAREFMHILPNSFSFSTTITLAFINSGYNVKYVPIEAPERVGKSKIKPFRDGFRFIMLIFRTIVLFDPLKVFLPMSIVLFLLGVPYLMYELVLHLDVPPSSILLIISSILIFFFGLLADQISSLRRELK
jgi:glycosyltransferase involved in cell wall biosynthesis